ncbi:MAG: 5'/3'-nucleotidase SurE [Christensenellales bacterium]
MNILIVNDDGVYASGIITLAKALSPNHKVTVVAPHKQMSGKSHSMSFHEHVNYIKLDLIDGVDCYATSGTPADCVKMGIDLILGYKPDLVISGINNGYNLGTDVLYSGTVGASVEAALMGVPSLAVSQNYHLDNYTFSADFIAQRLDKFYEMLTNSCSILSVNIPYCDAQLVKGVRFAKIGKHIYTDNYVDCGLDGYLLTGEPIEDIENEDDADVKFIRQGYITISPVRADFNDYSAYQLIRDIKL